MNIGALSTGRLRTSFAPQAASFPTRGQIDSRPPRTLAVFERVGPARLLDWLPAWVFCCALIFLFAISFNESFL
jgi:hypothetical protein